MDIEGFHNIIFCHCYSQNTADVKFYVVLKKYMKSFKYNGILSLKCQNGSLMKIKTKTKKPKIFIILCKSFILKSSVISQIETLSGSFMHKTP